ncbi:hypothetical protein SMB34_17670 [Thalassospira permensis NBRC 106175]|jgi:hypothetical protein|uniref:Uncharacterized protein n=2 Tax=Thalassospira permensis TaxID=680197 RepID=A0ABR4TNK7_9PROT|nr:hypothetical protein SMB34_17670 [Thalassospira permensis NBRC 106175]
MHDWQYAYDSPAETPVYTVAPNLLGEHRRTAEKSLIRELLAIAVELRTLDDIYANLLKNKGYLSVRSKLDRKGEFGVLYRGTGKLSLRYCCNKLIHAADIRPVYDKSDDNEIWFMQGDIELTGFVNKSEWMISIDVMNFLEGVMDICGALEKLEEEGLL